MAIDKSVFISGVTDLYPDELLEGRLQVEGNVIGVIFKDSIILEDMALDSSYFLTKDGRFLYNLAADLRSKGIVSIDEVSVLSNSSEEVIERLNEIGGYEAVQTMAEVINIDNWEAYCEALHKSNLILNLHRDGFNLLEKVDINDKKVQPLRLFKKMSTEDITDWYESRLAMYSGGYSSKVLEEVEIDFDDNFIEECREGLANGVPFDIAGYDVNGEEMNCLPFLSRQMNGIAEGTTTILGAYSSTGKTTLFATILAALMYRGDRKCLVISNEQKSTVFKVQYLVWILYKHFRYFGVTKKKVLSGNFSDEDRAMIKKAQEYWNKNFKGKIKFIAIPDSNMALVKKKMRENILRFGYNVCLYDTLKLDMVNDTDKKEYLKLIQDSRDLDAIAKKYNVIMLASLQLAMNTKGRLWLDSSCLSMSKQIVEVLEGLMLMRVMYSEEMDENSKFYCNPFRLKKVADKWIKEPYKLDKDKVYRILFLSKNRQGSNSDDTGEAYILSFSGEFGVFRECALCLPKHGFIQ